MIDDFSPRAPRGLIMDEMPAEPTDNSADDPRHHAHHNLIGEVLDKIRERKEQRKRARHGQDAPSFDAPATTGRADSKVTNELGIKELKLPQGYKRLDTEQIATNYMEDRKVFHAPGSPSTRIVCSQEKGWLPSAESQSALKAVLSKPAHKLTEEEVDGICGALPKPSFGCSEPYKSFSFSTKSVDGQNVLVMSVATENRRFYGYFFNPTYPTENKTGSLSSVWFEAPHQEFNRHSAPAAKCLDAIKLSSK